MSEPQIPTPPAPPEPAPEPVKLILPGLFYFWLALAVFLAAGAGGAAGLDEGDVILSVNGQELNARTTLGKAIWRIPVEKSSNSWSIAVASGSRSPPPSNPGPPPWISPPASGGGCALT